MFEQLRNAQPLQSLYDALAENFPVSLTDVAFNPGSMPAQVAGTINLFSGAGSVEIRLDQWRALFRGLRTAEDRKVILRCLNLAAAALEKDSDHLVPASRTVVLASWFSSEDGASGVAAMLKAKAGPWAAAPGFKSLGAEELEFTLAPLLRNTTEGWDASFFIQKSKVQGSHLFVNYTGNYIAGGRYNSVDQIDGHVESMLRALLEMFDVRLPQ
jgi:hypothetical protein